MNILILDNYDSFTYNISSLVHQITGSRPTVKRNNEISLTDIRDYDKIILSPGPGLPSEAGILMDLIRVYAEQKSILGICLGHQAIGEVFGGALKNLSTAFHGIQTPVSIISRDPLFDEIPRTIDVGRYHSWVIDEDGFPEDLEILAVDEASQIMSVRHKTFDVKGIQFHPESILTPFGKQMIKNWISC